MLSRRHGEEMTIKIQLGPELYDHIRTLVHDELNEQKNRQKNRQKIEQLAMKIRAQLDQLSGPHTVHNWSKSGFGAVLND